MSRYLIVSCKTLHDLALPMPPATHSWPSIPQPFPRTMGSHSLVRFPIKVICKVEFSCKDHRWKLLVIIFCVRNPFPELKQWVTYVQT